MSRILLFVAAFAALGLTQSATAQTEWSPGVTEVAPGVREIDGKKLPSQGVDMSAVETLIKEEKSLRAVRDLLGGDGITSIGPADTTVHIYKVQDTATGKPLIVLLFVKDDDEIVDHLVQDRIR
jgi:hypothetical protein